MNAIAAIIAALTMVIAGTGTGNITQLPPEPKIQSTYSGTLTDEYSITVNKATNCVTVYQKDSKGEHIPVKAMICSVGRNNATPAGSFKTKEKYAWRALFGNVYGQYATRIHGDILFHSVYYKTTDPATLKTEEYNNLGTSASAGCVRLTAADAKWIYDNCKIGTQVNIVDSGTDPLPRPNAIKLGQNTTYPNWDPTDPDPNNPWKNENVKIKINTPVKYISPFESITKEELDKLLREDVTAYDSANNIIDFDMSYSVDTKIPGTYTITYYASDCIGNSAEKTAKLVVYG